MDFARLRHALLDPAAWPGAPAPVTSLQTHISELFFVGDLVYKVKKPVDLGFLDFSTLAARKWACEEEVRLNRELAPGVYRRAAPIVRHGAGVRIARAGVAPPAADIIEYAVEMIRLPAGRMLDHLLERGGIDGAVIDALVERLASFHAAAPTGPGVDEHGSADAIDRKITDTLDRLAPFAGPEPGPCEGPDDGSDEAPAPRAGYTEGEPRRSQGAPEPAITPELLAHLKAWLQHELESRRDVIELRRRQGRIREGHGDLHAQNICLDPRAPGGLVIYDRLEFSRPLRCLDVAAEIAFLAMDLECHGHVELAAALTGQYARRTGDADLPTLQPLHRCHYAAVRAMVDSIRSREPEVAGAGRVEAWRSARRHLDLALGYTLPPSLVVMCGLPGTGKSWAAALVARALRALWLRSDEIRREVAPGAPPDARYAPESIEAVYQEMARRARAALSLGRSVVADATFSTRARRQRMADVARASGARRLVLHTTAPESIVCARLQARATGASDPSEADFRVYLEARDRFEPPQEADRRRLVTITPRAQPEHITRAVLAALAAQKERGPPPQ